MSKADDDDRIEDISIAAASQIHLLNNPLYADVHFIVTTNKEKEEKKTVFGQKCFF